MPLQSLLSTISDALKKNYPLRSRGQSRPESELKQESLQQLGLYLNRENNKQIFLLFEYILENERHGVTY